MPTGRAPIRSSSSALSVFGEASFTHPPCWGSPPIVSTGRALLLRRQRPRSYANTLPSGIVCIIGIAWLQRPFGLSLSQGDPYSLPRHARGPGGRDIARPDSTSGRGSTRRLWPSTMSAP